MKKVENSIISRLDDKFKPAFRIVIVSVDQSVRWK